MPDHDAEVRAAAYWHSMIPAKTTAQGTLFPVATANISPTEHRSVTLAGDRAEAETTTRLRP